MRFCYKGSRFTTFCVAVAFVGLFVHCDSADSYKLLYAQENFDESFALKVYYKDALSFGPHHVRIVAEKMVNNEPTDAKVVLEEEVHNDGKNLAESNIAIKWLKQSAELTLRGKEQTPKKYLITLRGTSYDVSLVQQ